MHEIKRLVGYLCGFILFYAPFAFYQKAIFALLGEANYLVRHIKSFKNLYKNQWVASHGFSLERNDCSRRTIDALYRNKSCLARSTPAHRRQHRAKRAGTKPTKANPSSYLSPCESIKGKKRKSDRYQMHTFPSEAVVRKFRTTAAFFHLILNESQKSS